MFGMIEVRPLTRFAAFFALILATAVGMQACSTNPRVDFANTQDTYNAVVSQLVANRDKFSDEDWEEDVLPAIQAGDAALDQYDLLTSADLDPDSARQTLRQVLVLLNTFLAQLE